MTQMKPALRLPLHLLTALLIVSTLALSAGAVRADSLQEVLDSQNIAKMNAIISYIEQNPEAEDIDKAYGLVFQLAEIYHQTEQVLPLAERYLESERKPAEAKAVCIQIKHLADEGKLEESVDLFVSLARFRSRQDPNAAGNCGFALTDKTQLAGRPDLARKVLMVMREVLPLHPSFDRQCESIIAKLDLVNKPAPEITVTDFQDNPIKLEDYKGKVILVDFWGTFCGPCIRQFPKMKETYAEFKDQGFEIIGISADGSQEQVTQFQETTMELPWKLAMSTTDDQETQDRYLVEAYPSTYLIDREGKVVAVDLSAETLDEAVRKMFQ